MYFLHLFSIIVLAFIIRDVIQCLQCFVEATLSESILKLPSTNTIYVKIHIKDCARLTQMMNIVRAIVFAFSIDKIELLWGVLHAGGKKCLIKLTQDLMCFQSTACEYNEMAGMQSIMDVNTLGIIQETQAAHWISTK
ncbi:hypothetical protein ACJX0J_023629 [Zea mays]